MRVLAFALALAPGAGSLAGPATDAYMKFRAALEKAASPADIAPFLDEIRREMLGVGTADEMRDWWKDFKETHAQEDVKVTAETTSDKGVRLSATGRDARDGKPVKGRIDMAAEGTAWMVREEIWYVEMAPAASTDAAKGDFAKGTFTVNGKAAAIRYVTARVVPYAFDETLPAVELTFSDVPVTGELWTMDGVGKGEIHGFELTVGPKRNVISGQMHHNAYGDHTSVSMAGMHHIEATRFGPTVIEGKAWIDKYSMGKDVTEYSVEFRATLLGKK